MAQKSNMPQMSWWRTARYGGEAGITLAFLYTLAFTVYAAIRATSSILATPQVDGGLAGTVVATCVSLTVSAFMFAVIAAIPAAIVGALTALTLRVLVSRTGSASRPRYALAAGLAVCLGISLAFLALLTGGLGIHWRPATAEALIFWLIVPLVVYTIAGGVASWYACRTAAA